MPGRDDDDDTHIARMRGHMRNERIPSGNPIHTDWEYIERIAALAAKAAVDAEAKSLEAALETAVVRAEGRLLERLGIANNEEGFTAFRKNQEWAQSQRELRVLIKKVGVGAIITAAFGVVGSAFMLWLQSKVPGK